MEIIKKEKKMQESGMITSTNLEVLLLLTVEALPNSLSKMDVEHAGSPSKFGG